MTRCACPDTADSNVNSLVSPGSSCYKIPYTRNTEPTSHLGADTFNTYLYAHFTTEPTVSTLHLFCHSIITLAVRTRSGSQLPRLDHAKQPSSQDFYGVPGPVKWSLYEVDTVPGTGSEGNGNRADDRDGQNHTNNTNAQYPGLGTPIFPRQTGRIRAAEAAPGLTRVASGEHRACLPASIHSSPARTRADPRGSNDLHR
jgi:hypothetical protein